MSTVDSNIPFDVESFFNVEVANFKETLSRIEKEIEQNPDQETEDRCVEEFTTAFHQSREECRAAEELLKNDTRKLAEIQKRFRDELAPWFDQSWFFDRAKKKPRGYPGDYVMLTALYNEEPKSTGLGLVMDRYFLKADLARAVRTRLADVKAFVLDEIQKRDKPVSILNVASGPGREYTCGFDHLENPVSVTCLDSDEAALGFLKDEVEQAAAKNLTVKPVCYNALKTTSGEKNIQNFGASDIVYSVGLCDYIPDRYMIRILEGWRQSVIEGGVVYVAFKDCREYVASEYQWHADWHFYLRTEEDCRALFEQAGYDMETMEMSRDSTGIIMNFVSRITTAEGVQFDENQELKGPHFSTVRETEASQRDSLTSEN